MTANGMDRPCSETARPLSCLLEREELAQLWGYSARTKPITHSGPTGILIDHVWMGRNIRWIGTTFTIRQATKSLS